MVYGCPLRLLGNRKANCSESLRRNGAASLRSQTQPPTVNIQALSLYKILIMGTNVAPVLLDRDSDKAAHVSLSAKYPKFSCSTSSVFLANAKSPNSSFKPSNLS